MAINDLKTLEEKSRRYHDKITKEYYVDHTLDKKTFEKLHTRLWVDFAKDWRRLTRGKLGAIKDKVLRR